MLGYRHLQEPGSWLSASTAPAYVGVVRTVEEIVDKGVGFLRQNSVETGMHSLQRILIEESLSNCTLIGNHYREIVRQI